MLAPGRETVSRTASAYAIVIAALGALAHAAGLAGFLLGRLSGVQRAFLFLAAAQLVAPRVGHMAKLARGEAAALTAPRERSIRGRWRRPRSGGR